MIQTRHNPQLRSGFTLVELMLAMAFVTMLLLVIAGVVLQIAGTYNKGVTIKSVNQAGRSVIADMRRTIAAGRPFDAHTNLKLKFDPSDGKVTGGRLCTGTYSYIWNIGTKMEPIPPTSPVIANTYASPDSATRLRFVRVVDGAGGYCADLTKNITKGQATELFADDSLAVQQFDISQVTTNAGVSSQLYRVTMMISNATTDAIDTTNGSCNAPKDIGSYGNYCAVNVFDFTVQAGSNGGSL